MCTSARQRLEKLRTSAFPPFTPRHGRCASGRLDPCAQHARCPGFVCGVLPRGSSRTVDADASAVAAHRTQRERCAWATHMCGLAMSARIADLIALQSTGLCVHLREALPAHVKVWLTSLFRLRHTRARSTVPCGPTPQRHRRKMSPISGGGLTRL